MAELRQERLQSAFGGLDHDSAPESVGPTNAPFLRNFLVDREGRLPMRGPVNETLRTYTAGLGEKPVAAIAHNNALLIAHKNNAPAASREPWVAPYRRAATHSELAQPSLTMYHVTMDNFSVAAVAGTADNVPGPRYARLGAYTYALAYYSNTGSVQNGGRQAHRALLRWDGTVFAPTVYANAPLMAQDLQAHNERLFVLGGMRPGTTTYKPNSLFWSDPGGPVTDTLPAWQDDVSLLTNEIVVGSDDGSDFGVALARIAGGLAILKRHSIYVYRGDAPSEASVRLFTAEQGCIDPRSVVEYEDGCFFMSDQGYMWFDGSQLVNVSQNLRSSLLVEAIKMVGDGGVDGGRVVCGRLSNGYIGVSVGVSPPGVAPSTTSLSLLYHPAKRAWVGLSFDSGKVPIAFGRTLGHLFLMTDDTVSRADKLVAPELESTAGSRGTDIMDSTTFLFDLTGAGPLFNGTGDALKNQISGEQMFINAADKKVIPARWESRLMQLAEPGNRSQLHRVHFDYEFKVDNSIDGEHDGWYVSLIDGTGNVLLEPTQLPAQGDASRYKYRRQHALDVFTETNDAQVIVEWKGDNLPLDAATIFNVTLVFQVTRRMMRDG